MLDEKDLQAIANLIDTKFDLIVSRLDKLEDDVSGLKDDVSSIKCTLEGETNYNIKLIAEAHLDSNRHTHEAESIAKEVKFSQELQNIRLNMLEGTVDRIKKAVGID